jgi:hypothetical protein
VEHYRRAVLTSDTSAEAEAVQVRAWQAMSPEELLRVVDDLSTTARALSLAGLRQRHPDAPEQELIARLAAITLGPDLARRVYPFLDRPDR